MRPQKQRQGELGIFIAERRKFLEETVTSLAQKAQVAPSSLSDIELGKRSARRGTLRKLSGPLGIDPNQLFLIAYLTQELRPHPVTPAGEQFISVEFHVTREESQRLEEYLAFLRFRRLIVPTEQNNQPPSRV